MYWINIINKKIPMIEQIRKKHKTFLLIACMVMIFMPGCSGTLTRYSRPNTDLGNIKRIAVLPVENFTSDEYADEKIRSLVIIDLLSRGLDVIEPGEVIKTLRESRVWSVDSLSNAEIQNICKILNADAVMAGSVSAFEIKKGITVPYPEVSVYLILYEAVSGKIIWSAWNTTGGASFWSRHFGAEDATLDETSRKVIGEAIDTLF